MSWSKESSNEFVDSIPHLPHDALASQLENPGVFLISQHGPVETVPDNHCRCAAGERVENEVTLIAKQGYEFYYQRLGFLGGVYPYPAGMATCTRKRYGLSVR